MTINGLLQWFLSCKFILTTKLILTISLLRGAIVASAVTLDAKCAPLRQDNNGSSMTSLGSWGGGGSTICYRLTHILNATTLFGSHQRQDYTDIITEIEKNYIVDSIRESDSNQNGFAF